MLDSHNFEYLSSALDGLISAAAGEGELDEAEHERLMVELVEAVPHLAPVLKPN